MLFKYSTNLNIDICKERLNNNINQEHPITHDNEILGWLIGNFIHLHASYPLFKGNSFAPVFWGHLSSKENETLIKGFFFIDFGVALLCIPIVFLLYSFLKDTLQLSNYQDIVFIIILIFAIGLILKSFLSDKKIIKEFIITTINTGDTSNRDLLKNYKTHIKPINSRTIVLAKLFFKTLLLIAIISSYIIVAYCILKIFF